VGFLWLELAIGVPVMWGVLKKAEV